MNNKSIYLKVFPFVKYVKGASRVCLVDYAHDNLFYLPKEYYAVLKSLERNDIETVINELDDQQSVINLNHLIEKLISLGMAMKVNEIKMFPPISSALNDEFQSIQNSIIELTSEVSLDNVKSFCEDLSKLNCSEIQLWIIDNNVSKTSIDEIIQHLTNLSFTYVDIHIQKPKEFDSKEWYALIEKFAILKKIIVYGADNNHTHDIVHLNPPHPPLSLGEIEYLTKNFMNGKCCGEIHFSTLDFSGYWIPNLLQKKNGCLYKKICLDRNGVIKHCPCLNFDYGMYKKGALQDIIESDIYIKMSSMKNDDICICKDCEYRYNCTGCRAFTIKNETLGKPAKCHYNPYSAKWE